MLLDKIKALENLPDAERFNLILEWFKSEGMTPHIHEYKTGKNIVLPSNRKKKVGIGSHFDTVPIAPGANDNASAVVVAFEIAKRQKATPLKNIGLDIFVFDEEERGLVGSYAYLDKFGLNGLIGFLNMELVGMGNQFAVWPLTQFSSGTVLDAFESVNSLQQLPTHRVDRVVMNTADHESFRDFGLTDSFTITCISDKDVEVLAHYYKALEFNVDHKTLHEIMYQAPLFQHYHQPTDKSEHLSEAALQMTADAIWDTMNLIDKAHV